MKVHLARLVIGLLLATALALAQLGGAILAEQFDPAPNDGPYWLYGTTLVTTATGNGTAFAWVATPRAAHRRALTLLGTLVPLLLALLQLR